MALVKTMRQSAIKQIGKAVKPVTIDANGVWSLIAQKAYELYERRGREDGHALDDWLEAETIVMGTNSTRCAN